MGIGALLWSVAPEGPGPLAGLVVQGSTLDSMLGTARGDCNGSAPLGRDWMICHLVALPTCDVVTSARQPPLESMAKAGSSR